MVRETREIIMLSVPIIVRHPIVLNGWSGFYKTVCHPDMVQDIVLKGSSEEQSSFTTSIENLMDTINVLQSFDCEVGMLVKTKPSEHLITGVVEVWSQSFLPQAHAAIDDIRQVFERMRSTKNLSSATISLSFCRSVKRAQQIG